MMRVLLTVAFSCLVSTLALAQSNYPAPIDGDFVARGFVFASGDQIPEVKIHYRTVGTPRKDADGVVRNAVLVLHGTGGTGAGFLSASYAGRLFGKGQPLDAEQYFIILPDNVGHGQSSRPSDGLRMKFPRYGYADMVRLQYLMVTQGLGLTNLKLVMGTSMGAMHAWDWGYMYPGFAAGLVPLASNPVEVGGRNRVWRKMLIDAIITDPTWKDGNYTEQPRGLSSAIGFLLMATSAPLQWQKQFPTREATDQWLADHGAIVVKIDNRGTPRRSREGARAFKDRDGRNGDALSVIVNDQAAVITALATRIPQMDVSRIGITGWSYGGTSSAAAVTLRPDVFKVAVAGAPVTDWADYDTHYTERYLDLPAANPEGYAKSNLVERAGELTRPLLLIHGSGDDNVYFLHSLRRADALFKAGKPFEFLPLVNFTHMVANPVVQERLDDRVAEFLFRHLGAPTRK